MVHKVFECIDKRDINGLAELFCVNVKEQPSFYSDINEFLDLFDGTFTDKTWSNIKNSSSIGSTTGYDGGYVTMSGWMNAFENVETTEGKLYKINLTWYLIWDNQPNNVGLTVLNARYMNDSTDSRVGIGK